MANIIEIEDCVGEFQLQIDGDTRKKFDVIRDRWTGKSLRKLLGSELGNLFIADLDISGVPETARFLDIYNPFSDDENNCVIESEGIKTYIKGIVWFYFARNNPMTVATGGNKISKSENSEQLFDNNYITRIFNESISTGEAIQWFVSGNSDVYQEENMQKLDRIQSW